MPGFVRASQAPARRPGAASLAAARTAGMGSLTSADPDGHPLRADEVPRDPIATRGLDSPSVPLESGVRTRMEGRLGHDLTAVRIHTNEAAAQAAADMRALAFTVGEHVAFGSGGYAPNLDRGSWLLEHELTHVLEQRRAGVRAVQLAPLSYVERVVGADAKPFLDDFDDSVVEIDRQLKGVTGSAAADLKAALVKLRSLRGGGKVAVWRMTGAFVYAAWHNATGELRLNFYFPDVGKAQGTLIHEAIHAVHAGRYEPLAKLYGEVLAAGGTKDEKVGILLLKWKAWTEYWAYYRQAEYGNLRQTSPEFRSDPHKTAMAERDVRASIALVKVETGVDFMPWKWNPPDSMKTKPGAGKAGP